MSQHVPDDLLQAFVEGDVGEQLAIHIAEHLDSCPACLNRSVAMEPLSFAFAALTDPEVPADLVASVLAEAAEPERLPITEMGIGAALLTSAAVAAAFLVNPVALAAELGIVLSAVGDVARVLAVGLSNSGPLLAAMTAVACIGLFLTARLAVPGDLSGLGDDLTGKRRVS